MAFYHTACFVFTIMIICNAVLYPNIFSTMFKMWFGGSTPEQEKEQVPEYPPHMRGSRGPGGRMRPGPGASAGPGPGGRPPMGGSGGDSSSFMAQQPEARGRGMMGTVLPVYAVGIFIYFGYVIYKVFLREKPNPTTTRPTWGYPEDTELVQDGPTPRREQEEKLQRQLAAELKAANYTDFQKQEKKRPRPAKKPEPPKDGDLPESTDEVDLLKRRLEETEKNMQRMMDMMNSMGVAMNQVSQHLASANDKPIPRTVLSKLNNPDEDDQDLDLDATDPVGINVDDLTDEEDLLIGDRMEDGIVVSSDEENDVSSPKDTDFPEISADAERRRSNKLNIVDVEADDYEYNDDDEGEADSDDESEEENTNKQEGSTAETLRRRNVRGNECSEGTGIEG